MRSTSPAPNSMPNRADLSSFRRAPKQPSAKRQRWVVTPALSAARCKTLAMPGGKHCRLEVKHRMPQEAPIAP